MSTFRTDVLGRDDQAWRVEIGQEFGRDVDVDLTGGRALRTGQQVGGRQRLVRARSYEGGVPCVYRVPHTPRVGTTVPELKPDPGRSELEAERPVDGRRGLDRRRPAQRSDPLPPQSSQLATMVLVVSQVPQG